MDSDSTDPLRAAPPGRTDRVAAGELSALLRRDTSGWRLLRPALLAFLIIIAVGAAFGALAYAVAGGYQGWPTTVVRTAAGWRISSADGLQQDSEMVAGSSMVWNNGGCLELLDLGSGKTTVLQLPSSGEQGSAAACLSERYVAWTTDRYPNDIDHLEIRAYDLVRHRFFTVPGAFDCDGSTPALSGSLLFWEGDRPQDADAKHVVIHGLDLASGRGFPVATGSIRLGDACGDLVMWTQDDGNSARDQLTWVKDLSSSRLWRLRLCTGKGYETDGCLLTGRALVWQLDRDSTVTSASFTRIEELDLDSGVRRVVAQGNKVWGLSAGGGQVVWSGPSRAPLAENVVGGPAVPLPVGRNFNGDLPVISDSAIAWIVDNTVETARLSR